MGNRRIFLMKLLALGGIFCLVYPAALILRIAFFGVSGGMTGFLYTFLLSVGAFFVGSYLLRGESPLAKKLTLNPVVDFLLDDRANVQFISRILTYLTLPVPVLISFVLYSYEGLWRVLLEVPACFMFYFMGLRASLIGLDSLINLKNVYAGALFSGAYIFAASYFVLFGGYRTLFLLFISIFLIISLWIQNQLNLDQIFFRKERNTSNVPRNIRKYNSIIVVIFYISIIVIFNFKALVILLMDVAGKVIRIVISTFVAIMSMLFPAPGKGESNPGGGMGFPAEEAGEQPNPIWEIILVVLVTLIALYLLYKAWPVIIKKIKDFLLLFINFIKKLFVNLDTGNTAKEEDYNDEIETIKPVDAEDSRRIVRKRERGWKRDLRKITDPVEKVRYLYNIILWLLSGKGMYIKPSDTTGDICKKAAALQGIDSDIKLVTGIYEEVRYGDKTPYKAQIDSMEAASQRMSETLRRRKA